MKTTVIDLLRHGEVEGGDVYHGSTDEALTDYGWQQMVDSLQNYKDWDIIFSSPLQSCCEFAELISSEDDIKYKTTNSLKEIDFGLWEGLGPDQLMKEDANLLASWWESPAKVTPPEGEDFHDFQARILKEFKNIVSQNQGEKVLLVVHSGVIRIILMHILSMPEEAYFRINVDFASFSRIHIIHDERGESVSLIQHG